MSKIKYVYAFPEGAFRKEVEPSKEALKVFYQEEREIIRKAGAFYNLFDFLRVGFGLPSRLESL